MIKSGAEIQVGLKAVVAGILAYYGFWGCALLVVAMLLPWKTILAVAEYLAEPLVEWRLGKGRDRQSAAKIESEMDALFRHERKSYRTSHSLPYLKAGVSLQRAVARPLPTLGSGINSVPREMYNAKPNLSAASQEIRPVIREHVQKSPNGVFGNMDLELEEVTFHGDTAQACVKFHSANVNELVIRQRYVLRKSSGGWQVESRQPANSRGGPQNKTLVPAGLVAGQAPVSGDKRFLTLTDQRQN